MKIANVRLGLATNSSSSHSILFPARGIQDSNINEGEYGWECFTLGSKESKAHYVALQIAYALENLNAPDIAKIVMQQLTGFERDDQDYIDHQSVWHFPRAYGSSFPDVQFMAETVSFFERDDVVILGGNDNGDFHPLEDGTQFILETESSSDIVSRKDGDFWTIFNRDTGARISFTWDNPTQNAEVNFKPRTPLLVDLKITDHCPFGCDFCYQGSTSEGKHADYSKLWGLLGTLREMKVFEVAIGGGEPTLHPNFISILRDIRSNGAVPNFTTRNTAWLRNDDERNTILKYAGGFAVSVSDTEAIRKIGAAVDYHHISNPVSIHIVLGTVDKYMYESMLKVAAQYRLNVTLLDYKTAGFGKNVKPQGYDWWLDVILANQNRMPSISIDTPLAKRFEQRLKDANIPGVLYSTAEGEHSMYIDAVKMEIARSSYDDQHARIPFDYNTVTEEFQAWNL